MHDPLYGGPGETMKVEFWGTRGSIATPGPTTVRYGGNTPCVSATLRDGSLLILDAGTGIRRLGNLLLRRQPVSAHLLLSHCHWDHIQGFPFFAPAYLPGTQLTIHGYAAARQKIRKTMTDQMEGAYFPVDFPALKASIEFVDVVEEPLVIATARISRTETNHPGGGAGFRIQEDEHSFVYLTDNELGDGDGQRFVRFCQGASLVIHDAQYTPEELQKHRGWGHSSYVEVLALAREAGVRQVALFHHDPERSDEEMDRLVAACHAEMARQRDRFECEAATEAMAVLLE